VVAGGFLVEAGGPPRPGRALRRPAPIGFVRRTRR